MRFFIDVLLPLALPKPFTYWVTEEEYEFLSIGFRVGVPFGKNKMYTAIVYKKHRVAPQTYEPKTIAVILEDFPIITEQQIHLWNWISSYYLCSMGSILRAALPSALLLTSETLIRKNTQKEVVLEKFSDEEFLILEALDVKTLTIEEVRKIVGYKNIFPLIQKLLDEDVIESFQELKEKFKPKRVRYVRLAKRFYNEKVLTTLFDSLKNAPKQNSIILGICGKQGDLDQWIKVSSLLKQTNTTSSTLKTLIDKEILEETFFEEDREPYVPKLIKKAYSLSSDQKEAFVTIESQFNTYDVALLEGVTSSGKTEVYFKLIEKALELQKQVLYLLPEISLTTQMIHRLQERFGSKVVVYHSKFSIHERVEVWNNILNKRDKAQIILGARSSIFLPFKNLGLIIVDEEHDSSFKQFDPAPRYHARDTAIVLGKQHGAKVLLGSATPAVETRFNVSQSKYGYAQLKSRYGKVLMPSIECIDLKESYRKKKMKGLFSHQLIDAIQNVLTDKRQVILFQNRRGYAPVMECFTCGHIPQCTNCDVTLTYHKYSKQLKCHYCGYHIAKPVACGSCGSNSLDIKGLGTQQIEEQVNTLFPDVKVARMDWDSTRGKQSFNTIIESFTQGDVQILVGTQMLTKGLDFKNVALVGVINADPLLNYPDFRAHERGFQILSQVAGRSGRSKEQGKVMIQTFTPDHTILAQVINNDYDSFFTTQLREREEYQYPPFHRLIRIALKARDYQKADMASQWFANTLALRLKSPILGPVSPAISRIRNQYHKQILIKFTNNTERNKVKEVIKRIIKSFETISGYKGVKVSIDVDPQ